MASDPPDPPDPPDRSAVAVRRYRSPLEGCVLVTVTTGGRRWRLLTGCGLRPGRDASDEGVRGAVAALVDDLVEDTTGDAGPAHLDVVALSHTGRSLAGAFAVPGWRRLTVGEVWLPWSEGPGAEAQRARASLAGSAERLGAMLAGLSQREATVAAQAIVDSCGRDDAALATLWNGFGCRPTIRALQPDDGVVVAPDGGATPLAGTFTAGPAQVRVLPPPRAGADRAGTSGVWANPALQPTSLRLFDRRFEVSQRMFVTRNLRAAEHNRMNLRALGKVAAVSRLQPLALALDLQRRHHGDGFVAVVQVGGVTLLLTGDHPVPRPGRRDRADGPSRLADSVDVLVTGDAAREIPSGYDHLAVVAGRRTGDGVDLVPGAPAGWTTTAGERWTEVASPG